MGICHEWKIAIARSATMYATIPVNLVVVAWWREQDMGFLEKL